MDSFWIVLIPKRQNFCLSITLSVKLNTFIPNIMLVLFPAGEGRVEERNSLVTFTGKVVHFQHLHLVYIYWGEPERVPQ